MNKEKLKVEFRNGYQQFLLFFTYILYYGRGKDFKAFERGYKTYNKRKKLTDQLNMPNAFYL